NHTRESPSHRWGFSYVYADNKACVAILLSASTRLLFLCGGFLVGLQPTVKPRSIIGKGRPHRVSFYAIHYFLA
ncbi:MAG: hypothetical protein K6G92_04910, partial [Bacteroidaceae bacterium]|nr:hypothetical protein [Bacteroidaceae bacterium]